MEITKMLLTPNNYSRPQHRLNSVNAVVIHYVGNANTTALSNRNYFENLKNTKKTYASSHYIIGLNGEIIMCVPENEVAYASNNRNYDTISIENCHPTSDGKFNDLTRKSLVNLCADICYRYNLNPINQIIRHYDITGKKCPLYWVNNPMDFQNFKKEVLTVLEKLEQLEQEIIQLKANAPKVYNTIEDIPQWGRTTIEKLINKGVLVGDGVNLNIPETMLRILIINDRLGIYN